MKAFNYPNKLSISTKKLFEELSDTKKYECRTVYEHYILNKACPNTNKITIVLRIDVDNCFHLSSQLARYMNEYELKASHYFLSHPDRYYDIWKSTIPKEVFDLGHEVGLHTDHYYEELISGIDGLQKLKDDIKRLSEAIGEPIKGMVAHGHPAINKLGAQNWDLTKNTPSKELGLEYHDGLKSSYIKEGVSQWEPKCDFRITDYRGISYSWGWNYEKNLILKLLQNRTQKGKVTHITFHTKNAFADYWKNWTDKYSEKKFYKENFFLYIEKKLFFFTRDKLVTKWKDRLQKISTRRDYEK